LKKPLEAPGELNLPVNVDQLLDIEDRPFDFQALKDPSNVLEPPEREIVPASRRPLSSRTSFNRDWIQARSLEGLKASQPLRPNGETENSFKLSVN